MRFAACLVFLFFPFLPFLSYYFYGHWRLYYRFNRCLFYILFCFFRFSVSVISPSHSSTSIEYWTPGVFNMSVAKKDYRVKCSGSCSSADRAASVSAAFLLLPEPLPSTVAPSLTSTVNVLPWSGPVASTT